MGTDHFQVVAEGHAGKPVENAALSRFPSEVGFNHQDRDDNLLGNAVEKVDLFQQGPVLPDIGAGKGNAAAAQVIPTDRLFQTGDHGVRRGLVLNKGADFIGHRVRLEMNLRADEERFHRIPAETIGDQASDKGIPVEGGGPDGAGRGKQEEKDRESKCKKDPYRGDPDAPGHDSDDCRVDRGAHHVSPAGMYHSAPAKSNDRCRGSGLLQLCDPFQRGEYGSRFGRSPVISMGGPFWRGCWAPSSMENRNSPIVQAYSFFASSRTGLSGTP